MKLKFRARISGIAEVAYIDREVECEEAYIVAPGERYQRPGEETRTSYCWSLQCLMPSGHSSGWELQPGTEVRKITSYGTAPFGRAG